jgi:hypothetical protein
VKEQLVTVRLADVLPQPVEWTWPFYLPAGMLTVLDGDPGLGKSTLTADLAARISTGRTMPDGSGGGTASSVVILSGEDDLARTIRPRLDAAGANVERIFTFELEADDGSRRALVLTPAELRRLKDRIEEVGASLAVIDPLVAYLPDGLDTNRDSDVRRVLAPLNQLAIDTRCGFLLVRHLRKSGSDNPLYRGGGSIGFIGAARAGLLLVRDPDDPSRERRILAPHKANLAPLPPSLAFRLVSDANGYPQIMWEGPSAHTADTLSSIQNPTLDRSPRTAAEVFLSEDLRGGPLPAGEVFRRAEDAGIAKRTLLRAKESLGVESAKVGRPGEPGQWLWYLPKDANLVRSLPTPVSGTLREELALFDPEGDAA